MKSGNSQQWKRAHYSSVLSFEADKGISLIL